MFAYFSTIFFYGIAYCLLSCLSYILVVQIDWQGRNLHMFFQLFVIWFLIGHIKMILWIFLPSCRSGMKGTTVNKVCCILNFAFTIFAFFFNRFDLWDGVLFSVMLKLHSCDALWLAMQKFQYVSLLQLWIVRYYC